jgi:putative inorganic carbon (hco3(-)) transporter
MNSGLLYLYLLIYFIRPAEWIPGMKFHWQLWVGILATIVIIQYYFKKPNDFSNNKFNIYLFIFVLICLISKAATGWFGGALDFYLKILPATITFYLISIAVNDEPKCQRLLLFIAILISFLCVNEILQITTGEGFGGLTPSLRDGTVTQARWYGIFNDPNDLGLAIVILVPFFINRILGRNLIYFVFFILSIIGVYYTNSRGTLVSLVISISMYFIFLKKNMKGFIIALISGIAIVTLGPSRVNDISVSEVSAYGRLEAWYQGLQLIKSNPIIGIGPGNFTEHYYITAHNSFILAAAETGLLGLLFYIGIILVPLYVGVKIIFQDINEEKRTFIASVLCGGIASCTCIFFLSRTYSMIPFMMSGILNATYKSYCPELFKKEIEKVSFKLLIIFALAIIFIFFIGLRVFL